MDLISVALRRWHRHDRRTVRTDLGAAPRPADGDVGERASFG
jgi:hypothetical protein